MSQAGPMMAGMMPGGGPAGAAGAPSAHAQAHLNPGQQAQMFAQNPQMHMSKSNPVSRPFRSFPPALAPTGRIRM